MRPIDERVGQRMPAKLICTEHRPRLVHRTSVSTSNLIHGFEDLARHMATWRMDRGRGDTNGGYPLEVDVLSQAYVE